MFDYQPLDPQNCEIRLVRLHLPPPDTGSDYGCPKNDKILLHLLHVSMTDQVPYAAVSYVWGSATDMIEVQLNGQPFNIGSNLHAALVEFRNHEVDRWLWIDAICINQSNDKEKGWHVDRMKDVFRDADVVAVWLGPGNVGTDLAMDFIARVGPRAISCSAVDLRGRGYCWSLEREDQQFEQYLKARLQPDSTTDPCDGNNRHGDYSSRILELGDFVYDFLQEPGWKRPHGEHVIPPDHLITGFQHVLHKDYWHRVWVIQEVTLARRGQVYCGGKIVTLDELDAVLTTLFYCVQNEPDKMVSGRQTLRGPFPGSLYPSKAVEIRTQYHARDPEHPIRLVEILLVQHAAPHRHVYTASDPRDLVFGLLGVIPDDQRLGMHADYTKSPAHVLASFTKALLHPKNPSHFSLNCSFPRENPIPDCPTWVPDWEAIGKYGIQPFPFHGSFYGECVTRNIEQPVRTDEGLEDVFLLRRHGCRVAVITEVMEPAKSNEPAWPWDWKVDDIDLWLETVRNFTRLGNDTGPGEDYIWRTIALNYKRQRSDGRNMWGKEHNALVRKIMRRRVIDATTLTGQEAEFFWHGPYSYYLDGWEIFKFEDRVDYMVRYWPNTLPRAERTLFKTNKGMFGIGHKSIQPGDVVCLIWEVDAPIILRPRDGGGFTMQGDAHVDGIMNGEFLDTNPAHEEFVLY